MDDTKNTKTEAKSQAEPISGLTLGQLKDAVDFESERREVIREFVKTQLEADKDYGTISIRGRDGYVTQSKPVLFKSGMEKIFSLFNVVSKLEKDTDTVEMVGKPGLIAYKCILTRDGKFISEGRGACEVKEKVRVNDAIKIAEKRARMDACLNLGFSEYFTQDLEDLSVEAAEPVELDKAEVGAPVADWKDKEVRNIDFTVEEIEPKTSQSGTTYALLHTDKGLIKAWKNTMANFEVGKTYKAAVEAALFGGVISLAVDRVLNEE